MEPIFISRRNKRMDKRVWIIAMAALFTTGGALAAGDTTDAAAGDAAVPNQGETTVGGAPAPGEMSFEDLDQDGDGQISQSEVEDQPQLSENFDQYDQNADSQLDQSEFAAFQESQGGAMEPGMGTAPGMGGGTMEGGSTEPGGSMGGEPMEPGGTEEPGGMGTTPQ